MEPSSFQVFSTSTYQDSVGFALVLKIIPRKRQLDIHPLIHVAAEYFGIVVNSLAAYYVWWNVFVAIFLHHFWLMLSDTQTFQQLSFWQQPFNNLSTAVILTYAVFLHSSSKASINSGLFGRIFNAVVFPQLEKDDPRSDIVRLWNKKKNSFLRPGKFHVVVFIFYLYFFQIQSRFHLNLPYGKK